MKYGFKETVKDIIIDTDTCYECDPCIHPVKVFFKDGSFDEREWIGTLIHEMLEYLNEDIPKHFKRYIKGYKGADDDWNLFG